MTSPSPIRRLAWRVLLCLAVLLPWGGLSGCQPPEQPADSLEAARQAAVERQRRVIFNNDGDDLLHLDGPATAETFLSVRTDHAAGTMVDTVFYFSRRPISPLYTGATRSEPLAGRLQELAREGADDLGLVIEASRKQGMEVFWSMRMNDIHDNAKPESEIAQWKKDHRHLLMGRPEGKERFPPSDPRNLWTFVDYAHPQVRDLMVETFNLFPRHPESRATRMARRVWKEIGDPERLAFTDKLYVLENLESVQAGFMMGSVPVEGRLPVPVAPGEAVQRILPVADDLAGAGDRLQSLELRLKLKGLQSSHAVAVRLNGERLRLTRRRPDWLIGPVPAQAMRRGPNLVKVELAAAAPSALTLGGLELEVAYRR